MSEALARLRRDIRANHDRLEAAGVFQRILLPDMTRGDLQALLLTLYRFYAAVEPGLLSRQRDWPVAHLYRARLPLLAECLGALDTPLPAAATINLDWPTPLHVLGAIYAIEGSALGGQVILRHCRQILGADQEAALRYFSVLAVGIGSHWQAVLSALAEAMTDTVQTDGAIAGANAVLRALQELAGEVV